jgi:hypothetical protein
MTDTTSLPPQSDLPTPAFKRLPHLQCRHITDYLAAPSGFTRKTIRWPV